MSYCIMRVEKRRRPALYGLQIEANRTADDHEKGRDFVASNIQWDLTPFNMFLVKSENWNKAVTQAFQEAEVQERKNSVVVLDGFYGASPDWFKDKSLDEVVDYFQECLAFHEKTYGKVINAVIHFDEATPHLAVLSLPLIEQDGKTRLSAKEIMGGRTDYRRRQDEFYEQVGKPRGMERGEVHDPAETRQHLTVQEFKRKKLHEENMELQLQSVELQKECRGLLRRNQQLQEINKALTEQTKEPFMTYCMMEFIKHAKVRGERGEVKLIVDGFKSYLNSILERLRAKWEQQLLPNYYPQQADPRLEEQRRLEEERRQAEEERYYEREYEEAEYDDRER